MSLKHGKIKINPMKTGAKKKSIRKFSYLPKDSNACFSKNYADAHSLPFCKTLELLSFWAPLCFIKIVRGT